MFELRSYQNQAIYNIKSFFLAGGKHCILQSPTGAGKTVIFSVLTAKTIKKNNKVLILTDRQELLLQSNGSIKRYNINTFLIQAGIKYVSKSFNCYIAMSQTFRRRIIDNYWIDFLKTINLIIIDEAHKQEFNYLFETGLLHNKFVIGFTATPRRSGKMRQLGLDYEKIIETVSVRYLIEKGYLVNDDYSGISSPDMSKVEIDRMKGDYKTKSVFSKFNSPKLYEGVIDNFQKICPTSKTLIFCVNIEHTIRTALIFSKAGIKTKFVTSNVSNPKTPKAGSSNAKQVIYQEKLKTYNLFKENFNKYSGERRKIFEDFKNNKFQVLINAGIATTGYDCPSIQTIILNRATISVVLLLQMVGRGGRIFPEKTHFNILDFGGNCERLGYYSEDREWSLWHEISDGKGLPPIKECGYTNDGKPIEKGGCRRLILASYKICPFCGFKYPKKKQGKKIQLYSSLYKEGRIITHKLVSDMNFNELHDYWKIKKHKTPWLWRQLWIKDGETAIKSFGHQFGWQYNTTKTAINYCKRIIRSYDKK